MHMHPSPTFPITAKLVIGKGGHFAWVGSKATLLTKAVLVNSHPLEAKPGFSAWTVYLRRNWCNNYFKL